MSDYVEAGEIGNIREIGVRMTAAAKALEATSGRLTQEIEQLESGQPWGDDHFGAEFLSSYNGDDGKGSNPQLSRQMLTAAPPDLQRIGDGVSGAMTDYQAADLENADEITRLRDAD